MSKSTKWFIALYGVWLLGFLWLNVTSIPIDSDWKALYFTLPISGPIVAIGALSVLSWLTEKLRS